MATKSHPRTHQWMKEKMPAFIGAFDNIDGMIRQAGPLDEKSIQLIQLAAAAAIRSKDALRIHTQRALEAGVSPAEIRHALLSLTSSIGFPDVAAALCWADDELDPSTSSASG